MNVKEDFYKRQEKKSRYWYNKAADLRASAGALWACMDSKRSIEVAEELGLGEGFSMPVATYPVYRMLCGMALELIYKAVVVAKNEKPNTSSHNLFDLASDAGLEISNDQKGILDILSESIIWAGRYPFPKKQEQREKLNKLSYKHLFDKGEKFGKLDVLRPNKALYWESFNALFNDASKVYWQASKNIGVKFE